MSIVLCLQSLNSSSSRLRQARQRIEIYATPVLNKWTSRLTFYRTIIGVANKRASDKNESEQRRYRAVTLQTRNTTKWWHHTALWSRDTTSSVHKPYKCRMIDHPFFDIFDWHHSGCGSHGVYWRCCLFWWRSIFRSKYYLKQSMRKMVWWAHWHHFEGALQQMLDSIVLLSIAVFTPCCKAVNDTSMSPNQLIPSPWRSILWFTDKLSSDGLFRQRVKSNLNICGNDS